MKSITIFCALIFLMVFNFTHAQNSPSDSMKYEEILKRIDALNTKFDDAINSKDCDKQKSKIEKELAKKSDTIRTLRKENSTLIANNKSLQKTDSINKNDLLKLKEDQIQVKSAISNLEKNKEELESYKSSAEKYKDSKEKQLETIRINLKSNIENSLKIDLAYASAVQLLLTNDSNSKDLINLLSEYLINQKAINEIDSIMRIQNFSNFKEVRTKISTISIKPSFKGQLSSYRRVSNNFETLVELVEKFRKLQTDYKNDDDAKFAYRFQSKVRVDRNDSMVKELFLNYPCLNYYSDLLMDKDNRKTYTLPSTN
jgi:hypothetical protein